MAYRALLGRYGVTRMEVIYNRNPASVGIRDWLAKYNTPNRTNRFGELKMFNPEVMFNTNLHNNGEPSVWILFLGFPQKKISVAGLSLQEIDYKIDEVVQEHKESGKYTHNYWSHSSGRTYKDHLLGKLSTLPVGAPIDSPPPLTDLIPPTHDSDYPPRAPKQVVHVYYPPKPALKWKLDAFDTRDSYRDRIDNYDDIYREGEYPTGEDVGRSSYSQGQPRPEF